MSHPVTLRIEEADQKLKRYGEPITPEAIEANIDLRWNDWTPDEAKDEALKRRIQQYVRARYDIAATRVDPETNRVSRERKDHWACVADELEEDLRVKSESNTYDRNRIQAQQAEISFLRAKEAEMGYTVYPELFEEEIQRLYRMNHCEPPARIR